MALDSTRSRAISLDAAVSVSAVAVLASRLLVFAAGAAAFAVWGVSHRAPSFDPEHLTYGFGALGDPLTATFARWDSTWYLAIADDGYAPDDTRAAFFPLYPLLMRIGGWLTGSPIAAGVLVSLACMLGALALLHRLTELELDTPAADATVWLLALFPMAFFFSAAYTESLFLLLTVAALYAARRERWAWAGALGALAAMTRNSGVLLIFPLALMFFEQHRAFDRRALWIALVPAGLATFCGALALKGIPANAPFRAGQEWFRTFSLPVVGIWDGAVAAFQGARQLLSGQREHVYFTHAGGDPIVVARMNVTLFMFLLAALPAIVGVLRRLPPAYGVYALAALALPLSYPVEPQPLMSLPRYEMAIFPLFMWGGWWVSRPERDPAARGVVYGASALGCVAFTALFATWHWVA